MDKFVAKEFENTKYLTGLRAYAALAVFLVHCNGLGLREINIFNNFFNLVVNNGKYGVVIFFTLSAYTIAMSLERNPDSSFRQYISRRLFRVVPMYYAAILSIFFLGSIQGSYDISSTGVWNNLLAHLSFLNLFYIEYRNNFLGVEWSIPIEIFYYLLLPVMFKLIKKYSLKNVKSFFIFLVISVFAFKLLRRQLVTNMDDLAYHWSIFKYSFCFIFGLFLYHAMTTFKDRLPKFNSFFLIGLFALLINFIISESVKADEFFTMWIGGIILVAHGRSLLSRILFENKLVMFLGTISYSFYLVHFPIINMVRYYTPNVIASGWFSLGLTIGCSFLTYTYIERPFLNGEKFLSMDYIQSRFKFRKGSETSSQEMT